MARTVYRDLSPLDRNHEGVRDHVANALQVLEVNRELGNFRKLAPYIGADILMIRRRLKDALTLLDQEIDR